MDPFKKFEKVDRWKNYFDETGKDVFQVIKFAIKVAKQHRPAGLLQCRDKIAEQLFSGFSNDDMVTDVDSDEDIEEIQHVIKATTENIVAKGDVQSSGQKEGVAPKELPKVNKNKYQDQSTAKQDDQTLSPKRGKEIKSMNLEKTKSYVLAPPSVTTEKKRIEERNLEASKRKLKNNCEEIENKRKKIRVIDFKDIPTLPKGAGSCGEFISMRPLVYRSIRTIR